MHSQGEYDKHVKHNSMKTNLFEVHKALSDKVTNISNWNNTI